MPDSFILFDDSTKALINTQLLPLFDHKPLPKAWQSADPAQFSANSRVYAYVDDAHIAAIIEAAVSGEWLLAILPVKGSRYAQRGFCGESHLPTAVAAVQQASARKVDLLRCNGQVVISEVVVGECFNLLPSTKSLNWRERVLFAFNNIAKVRSIRPQKMQFSTHNETCFNTAAVGIVFVAHAHGSSLTQNILQETHCNDGSCHAMIVAPRSVMAILRFFLISPLQSMLNIPDFIGSLKSKSLRVEMGCTINYQLDATPLQADSLDIVVQPGALNLLVGDALPIDESITTVKEQHKAMHLPRGEAIPALVSKPLPLIAHAATEEFKELYQLLRENARSSSAFLTLMVLSTLLASVGLFANSAPVIIGAMILAPLMAPIISLSMGLLRQEVNLLITSSKTLLLGLFLSLAVAACASFIMPFERVTAEISARLSPSLLDLAVAVISGIAAAYAHARIEAAKSMAGVAIAVALVPPLAVTGIGLGWHDYHVAWGALLLFLTNLAGIVFAACLTFMALGFAPFTRAKKGLTIALFAVFLVSIPLFFSFLRLAQESSVVQQLQGKQIEEATIRQISARDIDPMLLSIELVSPTQLSDAKLDTIKRNIEQQLQREVTLEATIIIQR